MKAKPFIAVCVASRGWGSYRTIASVMENLDGYRHRWHFAIGEPLPQAQNTVTAKALADPRTDVLAWVEDDQLWGPGFLDAMLALLTPDTPIAAIEYPLRNGPQCVVRNDAGDVEAVGLGCTLMRRDLFEKLPSPPFDVGTRLAWERNGWVDTGVIEHAGGFDIRLCRAVRAMGYRIGVVDGMEAGHLDLVRGGGHTNFGIDSERCYGGVGLPWRPEDRRTSMALRYLKSTSGQVLGLDPETGGDVEFYLRNGWTEISKSQHDQETKATAKAEKAAE